MIDPVYGIDDDLISAVGEFSINWNLFEHCYCTDDANYKSIKKIPVDFVASIEAFQESLIMLSPPADFGR